MRKDHTAWSRVALNALELLYPAGWPLEAIALHCGAIDNCERTRGAVFAKAKALGLKGRGGGRYRARGSQHDDELREMMALDFTQPRMARELAETHGLPFCQGWVYRRMKAMGGPEVAAWRKRASQRHSETMRQRNARERAFRRAAA